MNKKFERSKQYNELSFGIPYGFSRENKVTRRMKVWVGGESRRQDVGRSTLSSQLLASSHKALHYLYLTRRQHSL